ncbi:hypothetical protein KC19_VG131300 [Ceratodon purpureus]|uniref:Uncharacterized protein n=1 Tax=Ceratodon purpureus TaxID=3225 RepID=A0A8T0HPQ0_CERPU|nr:hypothetical protein KC19_VG131300 [Ceratodon purpureus]
MFTCSCNVFCSGRCSGSSSEGSWTIATVSVWKQRYQRRTSFPTHGQPWFPIRGERSQRTHVIQDRIISHFHVDARLSTVSSFSSFVTRAVIVARVLGIRV